VLVSRRLITAFLTLFLLFYGKKDLLEGTFKPKPEESFYANQRLAQKHL
jgi:hypothetical protein